MLSFQYKDMRATILFVVTLVIIRTAVASHFRGGSISWRPTGNGNEVNKWHSFLLLFVLLFVCFYFKRGGGYLLNAFFFSRVSLTRMLCFILGYASS